MRPSHSVEGEKPDTGNIHCVTPLIQIQNHPQLLYAGGGQDSDGGGVMAGRGHEGEFWGIGDVFHLHLGGRHVGVHEWKNSMSVQRRCTLYSV